MNKQMVTNSKRKINWGNITIVLLTVLLFAVLAITKETFLTYKNLHAALYGVAIKFFAVIGFTYLMIMGEIDLSVGSVYAFSGMLAGVLMKNDLPLLPAVLIALVISSLFGLLSGFIIVRFRLNSMMVTIGMMTLIRGLSSGFVKDLYGITYNKVFRGLAKVDIDFGEFNLFIIIPIMVILVVILEILLKRSTIFKKMYYVGENLDTARIYGIKAGKIKMVTFTLSALTAAIGGVLISSRVTYAEPTIGLGLEFEMLTAAVLGGASLYGGKGSILMSAVGILFLAVIDQAMIIYNIDPLIKPLIVGVILITAVFLDTRLKKLHKV